GLRVGSVADHPANDGEIAVHRITGPFRETGPNEFEVRLEKGLGENLKRYELWFAAVSPGNAVFKPAVQQAEMVIPVKQTAGVTQRIDFPVLADQMEGKEPVALQAVSDAGLPVHYFVQEGPAFIEGDSLLHVTPIPVHSRYPVKVTVVAWQWGRSTEPAVQTADMVTRNFLIYKKEK
ncbi:MAG TPA: hypothetical protein VN824_22065, partial [Puia sp.]|nr:hypothetical protein [Puia sp.]